MSSMISREVWSELLQRHPELGRSAWLNKRGVSSWVRRRDSASVLLAQWTSGCSVPGVGSPQTRECRPWLPRGSPWVLEAQGWPGLCGWTFSEDAFPPLGK